MLYVFYMYIDDGQNTEGEIYFPVSLSNCYSIGSYN